MGKLTRDLIVMACLCALGAQLQAAPPRLTRTGNAGQLLVHDQPFLVLGGELVDPWTPRDKQSIADHGGLVIWAGGEDYWFAGQGITITFKGADGGAPLVGLDVVEEGTFDSDATGCRADGSTATRRTRGGTCACRRATPRFSVLDSIAVDNW